MSGAPCRQDRHRLVWAEVPHTWSLVLAEGPVKGFIGVRSTHCTQLKSRHIMETPSRRFTRVPLIATLVGALIASAATPALAQPTEQQPAEVVTQQSKPAPSPPAKPTGAQDQTLAVQGVHDEALDDLPTAQAQDDELAALTEQTETIEFIAAGATWSEDASDPVTDVSIRVREEGQWTDWSSLEVHTAEADGEKTGTEPLLTTGADAVQVKVTTESGEAPEGLKVDLIDPGTAPQDGQVQAPAAPTAAAGTAAALRPAIVTRAQWGATESWSKPAGTSTKLRAMVLHHTASTNNYTKSTAAQQIRAIYSYHTRSLGWPDMGYNFLIDKSGTIYEGRKGSLDKLVIGSQAAGFNTDTIGISALGNYEITQPPAALVSSIEKVMAWQAARWGLNPTGTTTLTSRASAGSTSRYSYGTTITVPTIIGHRVTSATACPGQYLNPKLPTIRTNVKKLIDANEATPEAPEPPATPGSPSYKLNADGLSAQASWSAVSADHYQIMYRAVPQGDTTAVSSKPWIAGRTTTGRSITLSADPGETAQFAVRAVRSGVPGPQRYLGQHTGPISFNNASVSIGSGMSRVSDTRGIWGSALRSTRAGSMVTVKSADHTRSVTVSADAYGGAAGVDVLVDGKLAGGMELSGSRSVCTVPVPAGRTVSLVTRSARGLTLTSLALNRSGQSAQRANVTCTPGFSDNPGGSQFFEAVHWMQWSKISQGYAGSNTFGKSRAISRGESLTFLHRYVDPSYKAPARSPFRDVSTSATFFLPITWGSATGVVTGYKDGTFRSSRNVTRGEFAMMLYRTAKPRHSAPAKTPFRDVSSSASYYAAVTWMAKEGLTTGYSDGSFRPSQNITRGEVAAIMHRWHQSNP